MWFKLRLLLLLPTPLQLLLIVLRQLKKLPLLQLIMLSHLSLLQFSLIPPPQQIQLLLRFSLKLPHQLGFHSLFQLSMAGIG
jgi:hypothetical protein